MLQHFIIQCPVYYKYSLTGGEKQRKISNFHLSLKVVMVAYESWSRTRSGHIWTVHVMAHVSIYLSYVQGSTENLK